MSILEMSIPEVAIAESPSFAESTASYQSDPQPLPPIDCERLLERCLNNIEFALMLLDQFESTSESRLEGFRTALANQDQGAMHFKAHALKGVVAILAADALKETCSNIEAAAKARDWETAGDFVEQLEHEMQRVLSFIPNIRAMA